MSKPAEIIVIHESVSASYLKDLGTALSLLAVVGIGIWLDSDPLQWVGALMWIVAMLAAAIKRNNSNRMTVTDARKRIDEIEARLK